MSSSGGGSVATPSTVMATVTETTSLETIIGKQQTCLIEKHKHYLNFMFKLIMQLSHIGKSTVIEFNKSTNITQFTKKQEYLLSLKTVINIIKIILKQKYPDYTIFNLINNDIIYICIIPSCVITTNIYSKRHGNQLIQMMTNDEIDCKEINHKYVFIDINKSTVVYPDFKCKNIIKLEFEFLNYV